MHHIYKVGDSWIGKSTSDENLGVVLDYKLNMSQLLEGLLEFWPAFESIVSKMQEVVILLYLTMTISGILCRILDTLVPRGH